MAKITCTLLVDDDDTANFLNELLFNRIEATDNLLVARNGLEAINIINQNCPGDNCPNLILLDINMPIMDGFEFLEAFEKLEFEKKELIVIYMLTTSLNPQDVARVRQANVAGLVNKPLTKMALQELLAEHFNQ